MSKVTCVKAKGCNRFYNDQLYQGAAFGLCNQVSEARDLSKHGSKTFTLTTPSQNNYPKCVKNSRIKADIQYIINHCGDSSGQSNVAGQVFSDDGTNIIAQGYLDTN
jgi:hypothetical protein